MHTTSLVDTITPLVSTSSVSSRHAGLDVPSAGRFLPFCTLAGCVLPPFILTYSTNRRVADPLDWANANYIISLRNRPTMQTQQAASAVIRMAGKTAKGGPWSACALLRVHQLADTRSAVTSSRIRAPSGDPKDYFSWAPYRWPDCNKCASDDDDAANGADGEQENNDEDDDEQGAPKRQQVIPLRRRAHSNFTTTSLAMSTSAIFEPASVEPLVLARKPTPTPTCATRTKPATPEASASFSLLTFAQKPRRA